MSIPIGPTGGAGMSPAPNKPTGGPGADGRGIEWASWVLIGLAIAAVVMLAVLGAAGPGPRDTAGTSASASGATGPAVGEGETLTRQVSIEGMLFVPNSVEIPAGSTLVLEITNNDSQNHDLQINGVNTGLIAPGETVTQDFGAVTESVTGWCTVAGHKAMGMTFDVTVTDGGATGAADGPGAHMAGSAPAGSAPAEGANPFVTVPSAAQRGAEHEGFTPANPVLAPAPTGTVHEFDWDITEEVRQVAPGHSQVVWLFDGQAPGPTLRGQVGDTFRITLHNKGTMDHSIDFHAGEVNPDKHMAQIPVGESLTYEFVANRYGIWMYHCATAPMSLHIANGMFGGVVIDPPAGSADALSEVDEEYLFVASEMFLGPGDVGADAQRVSDRRYDLTAFNFYPNQYDLAPIEHKVGDTVRLWLLNAGPDQSLSFHVVGDVFDTVFTEGRYIIRDAHERDTGAQAVDVSVAQGGFVELTFNEPGNYAFVNHQMTDAEKGQHGFFTVTD
ncbi:multicopper oxidase domain-containing protein [Corynebacterium guangdongense]|uniref:Copper-containing nitrite reductase n=1 Tax=Corynebacterium guangdongense TaxID=1783348 RepID=A0ABU1ZVY7_9CORY|nr:multicopper oxidase domain-containing protein [Corynebacterium guangdongense]MDR7329102.1 nitrite reductase (NO-forming) [Corynebacterium guangdongense]WJZ17671.1 Copper-containing nitrite reductase precursor [Corynebacterium guangdongense]